MQAEELGYPAALPGPTMHTFSWKQACGTGEIALCASVSGRNVGEADQEGLYHKLVLLPALDLENLMRQESMCMPQPFLVHLRTRYVGHFHLAAAVSSWEPLT